MQDGVIIVNAARGGVIDTQALVDAPDSGKVYAAGLDVTAPEPLDPGHTLLNRDNVVVTPHIASATDKGRVRMYSARIENARQVLAGERPVDCVNPHVYEVLEAVPRECTQEDPGRRRRLRLDVARPRSILQSRPVPEREFDAELVMISDNMASRVDQAVADFGFGHGSVDWNDLIANDDIDVVVIRAEHAARADCDRCRRSGQACVLREAGGRHTRTDRSHRSRHAGGRCDHGCRLQLPMGAVGAVRQAVIDAGELGEITNYRGRFFSMYGADPMGLLSWRFMLDEAGHGVSSDILSHSVDLAHMLIGGIEKVVGMGHIQIPERHCPRAAPTTTSASPATRPARSRTRTTSARARVRERCPWRLRVESLDHGSAEPVRARGVRHEGVADVEPRDDERTEAVRASEPELGYKTVYSGDRFPYHGHFVPGDANLIGYEDLKVIEEFEYLSSVANGRHTPASRRRSTMSACRTQCCARGSPRSGKPSSG